MNIRTTRVSQILLLRPDQIPIRRLASRVNLAEITSLFGFGTSQVVEQAPGGETAVLFEGGALDHQGRGISISRLAIEERRILLTVEGSSGDAELVYASLANYLAKLAEFPSEGFDPPLLKSEESEIVAQLAFPFSDLVSPALWNFMVTDIAKAATFHYAEAKVIPAHLSFYVEYFPRDESLSQYRISLIRKEISLEPRMGFPVEEQVYFSKAPFDTDSHADLLSRIEGRLAKPQ